MIHHAVPTLFVVSCLLLPACAQQVPAPQPAGSDSSQAVQDVQQEHPVTPPKVACNGNQLSITASNSTLASILAEVRKCSGAQIDAPDSAAMTRVFDQLGPGPIRQVLDSLLSDSGFNYVIGSSDQDPDKIESILLLARAGDTSTATTIADSRNLTPQRRAFLQMRETARPKTPEEQSAIAKENQAGTEEGTVTAPTEGTPDAAAPPAATDNSAESASPVEASQATPPPDTPPASDSAAKPARPANTTEDQITNMEQMFQQRQKLNQQSQTPPPS